MLLRFIRRTESSAETIPILLSLPDLSVGFGQFRLRETLGKMQIRQLCKSCKHLISHSHLSYLWICHKVKNCVLRLRRQDPKRVYIHSAFLTLVAAAGRGALFISLLEVISD